MRITNEVLKEYLELKREADRINKRLDEIKEACKQTGPIDTGEFVVAINEAVYETLKGLDKIAAVFGKDKLQENNLINIVVRQTVVISPKKVA